MDVPDQLSDIYCQDGGLDDHVASRPVIRGGRSAPGEGGYFTGLDGRKKSDSDSTCLKSYQRCTRVLDPFSLFIFISHQLMRETAAGSRTNVCVRAET